tara:strand:+ start:4961 stop:5419 length:459 start_codon:yes stop_codon:yes gene_type:complete
MSNSLLIGFGTETGNSELLAMDALKKANEFGIEAKLAGLDDVECDDLKDADYLIIVCSTWGDGEQPDNAIDLYEAVEGLGDDELSGTKFAILALGDTAFDLFCEAGIQWDELLENKGGTRFYDRIDCDTDYEDEADEWIDLVINKIGSSIEN